jgi:aryl-alcohol dehydrogenase-like predicted oxidoreductase
LGGVLKKERDSSRRLVARSKEALDAQRPQIEAYEMFCESLGHEPADVALAWLLAQPAVTAPIIGPRTMEQLSESLKALEVVLTPENLEKLNEIFPGYKTSPEDYAW